MTDQIKDNDIANTIIMSSDRWVYGFTQIDNGVIDHEQLDIYDKMVYIAIRRMINQKDHITFPSYETIAKVAGCSRRKAIDTVKRLREFDLIRDAGRHSKYGSNIYMLQRIQESSVLADPEKNQEFVEREIGKRKPDEPSRKPPTDSTGKPDKDTDDGVPIADVIKYLNEKAGKKLNPMTENNRKDIRSRWKECRKNNMSETEIKRIFVRIIDLKVAQFSGKIFEDRNNPGKPGKPGEFFLKPVNLFNQKNFVKYCDEIDLIDQGKMVDGQATAPTTTAPKFTPGNNRQNQNQAVLDQLRKKYAQGAQQ